MCNHFPHVFQQGGLVSNRDNRNKQGGLGARPNVFLHAAAHARIVPLKSDFKNVVRHFGKYPYLLSRRELDDKNPIRVKMNLQPSAG